MYEKDDNYDIVIKDGDPIVVDAWVTVYFMAPDGSELFAAFEREPFDLFIFPSLFAASIAYWMDMSPGDPLFQMRSGVLEDLMELKKRFKL